MTPSQEVRNFLDFERSQTLKELAQTSRHSERMERVRARDLAVEDAITIISDAATMPEALAAMRHEMEFSYDVAKKLYYKKLHRASMEEYAYARQMRTIVKYVSRFEGLDA